MARFAPLLRALLCLLLLVNGSASAHMAASTALSAPATASVSDDTPSPPCHEDMDDGDMAGMQDTDDHHAPDGAPDCCKAGTCDGFCTQHAPALVWPVWLGTGAPLHAAAPDYAADGHASARLSHRHRPPILVA